ncbi:surfactin synthase thioesterase subunit [Paenibacillus shirakamiensis]|uniref:Surfactin synthase thioesterase subunit n=1 Tax=Paenibacillus shirakamiensis TaxID=1265935 RepID=A0ABS4JE97_9BACL|nr:thioesterase [Paenibacillus shirakamiensis]MBP2000045.1 surfactin synthase thioesterase subunit [Paenibacillus shirakamiensis]
MSVPLICLPYAGGSAQVYKRWMNRLHPSVRLVPAELAGRGSRMKEPFYMDVAEAVQDLLPLIRQTALNSDSYALFGHSMGCLLGYEVLHALFEEGTPLPSKVFFSGRGAPHCEHEGRRQIYRLPDDEFLKELQKFGGMKSELFEHPELLKIFMPILRADIQLVDEYVYHKRPPLPLRLDILNGQNDDCITGPLSEWELHTTLGCEQHAFDGGHFYLDEREQDVIALINKRLSEAHATTRF